MDKFKEAILLTQGQQHKLMAGYNPWLGHIPPPPPPPPDDDTGG